MKRFLLLIALVILMPLTLFTWGATTESNEGVEAELKSLRSQVESLKKRVATLETQQAERTIKDLRSTISETPPIPKGWLKRQFNGMPYYVIPLHQNLKK